MKTSLIALSTALAVIFLGIIFPSVAVADNPSLNETGVAVTNIDFGFIENSHTSGGSSEKAIEYHDLAVDDKANKIMFHNYVNIHDERIESTNYYVEIFFIVVEHFDDEQTVVYKSMTHAFDYSPPYQFDDFQYGTIEVELSGVEYHEYEVISDYDFYEIKKNGETEKLDFGPRLSQFAKVYETGELIKISAETSM